MQSGIQADAKLNGTTRSPRRRSGQAGGAPERLVWVAREMFCRDGIHATGIDRILMEAGVSKMTLYARFGSKEELVREVLRQEGAQWRAAFFAAVEGFATEPAARLSGVMAALEPWFRGDRFYGCAFMNAVAEHTKGEAWLRELAADHQRQVVGFLAALAGEAGFHEPTILARQIMLLIDGAIAAFLVSGDPAVLHLTGRNLQAILAQATPARPIVTSSGEGAADSDPPHSADRRPPPPGASRDRAAAAG